MPTKSDAGGAGRVVAGALVAPPEPDPPHPATRTSMVSAASVSRTHVAFPEGDHFSTLTARAATTRTVVMDTVDSIAIASLAGRVSGITSVGLNAVAFVR